MVYSMCYVHRIMFKELFYGYVSNQGVRITILTPCFNTLSLRKSTEFEDKSLWSIQSHITNQLFFYNILCQPIENYIYVSKKYHAA